MPAALPDSQVLSNAGALLLVADIVAAVPPSPGKLSGAKVDLFTNNFTPTALNVLADFTKAAYTGYAQATVAGWGSKQTLIDGRVAVAATNLMEFVGPAAGAGPTIYGYIVQTAAGLLLYSVKFASPITLTDATKALDLVATFVMPNVQ